MSSLANRFGMIRGVRAVVLGGSHARDALRRWKPLYGQERSTWNTRPSISGRFSSVDRALSTPRCTSSKRKGISLLSGGPPGTAGREIRRLFIARSAIPARSLGASASLQTRPRDTSHFRILSTLAVFSLLSAAILAVQTGVAIGFGVPALTVLASRHTAIEALDIFSTVVAYVGFIFVRIGVPLDLLVMALTVAIAPIAFPS